MKKLILLPLLLIFLSSCYGDKLTFNGTDVYYKDGATKEDAEKLGAYLVENEFADGVEKSVQLVKNDEGNFVFRMVVQEGAEEGNDLMFQLFTIGLSSVFDDKPVDIDLCDNTFNTLKTIPFFGNNEEETQASEPAEDEEIAE